MRSNRVRPASKPAQTGPTAGADLQTFQFRDAPLVETARSANIDADAKFQDRAAEIAARQTNRQVAIGSPHGGPIVIRIDPDRHNFAAGGRADLLWLKPAPADRIKYSGK